MRRAPPAVVVAALCAAGLVAAPSCLAPKGFRCDADGECGGGLCETTRYCSLADATCPSGRR